MQAISIVIPTYTAVDYLKVCLESILQNQYNPNNEVIIVVDGTYDLHKATIEYYKTKLNLKCVIFDENRGLSFATNFGFYAATNVWVLNINDDNVCPKNFDQILINHADGDCGIIYTPNQIEPNPSIFKPFKIKDFGDVGNFDLNEFTREEQNMRQEGERSEGWTLPLFLRKDEFIALGGFDVTYNSPHVIDWEFFHKAETLGLSSIRMYKCNFYHFGSKTARSAGSIQREQEAHQYFKHKWGHPATNKLLQLQ